MNQTPNYQLNQWEADDQVQRTDFNGDNAKIDAALGALTAQMATRGNCQIVTGQYTGTGTYGEDNPTVFTFNKPPALVGIAVSYGAMIAVRDSHTGVRISNGSSASCEAAWNGNSVSLYSIKGASFQMNNEGTVYTYFAILEA